MVVHAKLKLEIVAVAFISGIAVVAQINPDTADFLSAFHLLAPSIYEPGTKISSLESDITSTC